MSRMGFDHFISELEGRLSAKACILTDPSSKDFQIALQRWSDVEVQIPGAIVQVAEELDAVTTASACPPQSSYDADNILAR